MPLVTAGTTAAVVAAGTGVAFAQTHQFGTDQVGQITRQGPGRLRRPVPQPDRQPPRHQQRQDHVVVGQPGRHPPRGRGHRRRDGAGHRGPEELEGAAARRQQRRGGPADQRQRRRPGRPHVLARRHAAVAGPGRRLPQVHRERRTAPSPTRRSSRSRRTAPSTRSSAQAVFSPDGSTVYSAVNGQNRVVAINAATGADPAELGRGQRPARHGPGRRPSSTSATRAAARRGPATPRSTRTTPRCRPTR